MAEKKESFFNRFFGSIFASNDPEVKKKKKLRSINKELNKSKYHAYFKNDEVLPPFAKLFYDIYKAVSPAQAMFQAVDNPNTFKYMVVNSSLTEKQKELSELLTKEAITAKAQSMSIKELEKNVKDMLSGFLSSFDSENIGKIDLLYKKVLAFKQFCTYDFYFLLKKFDSSLNEREFTTSPKFEKINAEYIGEDLKDFLAIAWPLMEIRDWADMLKMFKDAKGTEPVNAAMWTKIVNKLRSIRDSRVFELMLKLITKDPDFEMDYPVHEEQIVDAYLDKIRQEAENTIAGLSKAMKTSQIDNYLNQIFGTTAVVRMRYYTEGLSASYERKNVGSYLYVGPLNYYKAFLLDYIKKDLREFADLVLIRGTWSSNTLSTPMSNAYNSLLESSDHILQFDDRLAEDGDLGSKLKTLLPRCERDKEARNIIATTLKDINDEARNICIESTKDLITIAKTIKTLMEDYAKPKGEVVINWKELDKFSEHPVKQLGTEVYKHIYLFVQLMQSCFAQD